ncbi:YjcZ family sporulation protein [Salipaludibacillus aurantiacus]|nr:YjcZ family sporulation protein [Salipaludibacillus aurantiacus]
MSGNAASPEYSSFTLIVVLFILLIIIGAAYLY